MVYLFLLDDSNFDFDEDNDDEYDENEEELEQSENTEQFYHSNSASLQSAPQNNQHNFQQISMTMGSVANKPLMI